MIKVDLITGFLGSGKTTFIKKYASHFINKGQRIGILENDYGAVNVDMMLLKDLRGDMCELEMVAGACDSDCHARRFKTKLISMAMSGYDRVIIEPSGIFDVDEFFDVIRDEPLDNWYEIGNVITIVDARLEDNLSDTTSYYLASQIANAGKVVLSRVQLATPDEISATRNQITKACESVKLRRDISDIFIEEDWFNCDFAIFENCGYRESSYIKLMTRENTTFETLYYLNLDLTEKDVTNLTEKLFDGSYGDVLRIKGFIQENNVWKQINATPDNTEVAQINEGQKVLIVIGENLKKDKINGCLPSQDSCHG